MRRRKREWRIVNHANRVYLVDPSGSVDHEGGLMDAWNMKAKAERLNRELAVERLVKRGKL